MKLTPVLGIELEFYIANPEAPDEALTNPLNGAEKVQDGVLSIDDIYDYSKFLDDICQCCEINDIALDAISSESGRGQFELCLKHTDDILNLADGLIFLKNFINCFHALQPHGLAKLKNIIMRENNQNKSMYFITFV